MKTNAIADLNPIYARNLLILSAVIAGKAIVSLALSALVGNIMAVDIIASAVLVAVVLLLVRSNVLRSSSSETDDDTAPLFGKDILSSLRAVAIPLAGCLVCQCSLGIGWAAMIFEHYSMVLQTRDSFLCVCAGALLCALCLVMVRTHIRSIVNFRYYAILACLLLLVVPWVSADLSGEARTVSTALPWGFSSSFLSAIVIMDLVSIRRKAFYAVGLLIVILNVAVWLASGFSFVVLGDEVANALWRISLIALIALSALEILREYRLLEKRLAETSSGKLDGEKLSQFKLTNRESEVLDLLIQGRRASWIAQKLYISDNTARAHVKHIYQKLGVHTREELLDFIESLD